MSQQSLITFSPKQYTPQHIPNKLQDIAYLSPNFVVLTLQLPELMHELFRGGKHYTAEPNRIITYLTRLST